MKARIVMEVDLGESEVMERTAEDCARDIAVTMVDAVRAYARREYGVEVRLDRIVVE